MSAPLVLVLAAEADSQAHALAARRPELDLRTLTPADLSRPGWEFRPGSPEAGSAAVGDDIVPTSALAAVLVRLPWVAEHDLPHIDSQDRAYVAAEMTAFLLAWLSALPCPVLNRPSTTCLAGPLWRPERWAMLASSVGLPVVPVRRCSAIVQNNRPRSPTPSGDGVAVTVIGQTSLGVHDPCLNPRLHQLAQLAGATALTIHLSDSGPDARFLAASPWPDLADDAVLTAVLRSANLGVRPGDDLQWGKVGLA